MPNSKIGGTKRLFMQSLVEFSVLVAFFVASQKSDRELLEYNGFWVVKWQDGAFLWSLKMGGASHKGQMTPEVIRVLLWFNGIECHGKSILISRSYFSRIYECMAHSRKMKGSASPRNTTFLILEQAGNVCKKKGILTLLKIADSLGLG